MAALVTNAALGLTPCRFSGGDANIRPVWICSRDDAISNVSMMLAADGVFGTG